MTSSQHDFHQLRQQFLQGLPQRALQMQDLWHKLRYFNWTQQGIQSFHSLVHRLYGAGSSFGCPEISESAKQLDQYLQEQENYHHALGAQECEVIENFLVDLVKAMDKEHEPLVSKKFDLSRIGKDKLIYILDDDIALSSLLISFLQAHGFQSVHCVSTDEILSRIDYKSPDFIFFDVGFGAEADKKFEVISHITEKFGKTISVLFVSARTDIQTRLRALRAGSRHYIAKPIDFDFLTQVLHQLLTKNSISTKVMIVDDDQMILDYFSTVLKQDDLDVVCVNKPLLALQRAIEYRPDLVILDMHMPDINGFELAVLLREQEEFIAIPIMFLTSDSSSDLKNKLESIGIEKIVQKSILPDTFIQEVKKTIREGILLKNRIGKVTKKGSTENRLTKSYFLGTLENTLAIPKRSDSSAALYYVGLDIDSKTENSLGIDERLLLNDLFCKKIAELLSSHEQWIDISDTTVCILTAFRSPQDHQTRIQQLKEKLSATHFSIANRQIILDVAVGVCLLTELTSVNQVLAKAEAEYSLAKVNQPSTEVAVAPLQIPQLTDEYISFDFSERLPVANLCLAFQSIVMLDVPDVDHFEVLVRWKTDRGDLLPASRFMSSLNDENMRIELDRWVLQQAINALAKDTVAREDFSLFFHLNPHTLENRLFFSFVTNVLKSARIRGEKRLIFMVDEAWIVANPNMALAVWSDLKDIHCGVCLDHAGKTADLEKLLTHFPVDYIKLHPDFTRGNSESDTQVIKRLSAQGKALGAPLIASQVEAPKTVDQLWQQGIRMYQGFYIQSPDVVFHPKHQIVLPNS